MSFPIYDYPKSREAFARALNVIPSGIYGHQGPSEGCYIPYDAYPLYSSRAKGTKFWDADGNEYIDYMCGYGPNVLGYCDESVDAAALEQLKKENCTTIPSTIMVDFAELLVDTAASADWAFFAKNGGDVTTLAIMTARAATMRKKIIFFKGYYHGVAPWAQKLDYPGVLEEDVRNNIYLQFNDYDALEKCVSENKGKIAAIISQPYMHGNFFDNELPKEGFWKKTRQLCTREGIVLIIDDVRTGFRLDLEGSDHFYGFKADLICFCKALANGYNVSALCGVDSLKDAVSSITYTGSYWMSAVPFAAGLATIKRLKEIDAPRLFCNLGLRLCAGLRVVANTLGYHLNVSGEPALFYLRLADDDSLMLHQEWIAACVRRGVFFTCHHNHFINAALTNEDIDKTIEIAADALEAVKKGRI
ncbi:MAG: aminotransferase class III-fold pyridoxal phosphate-dependent enzyme [Clostridiales bacterium]|jgi:glutamate-1-semialdehyde 2,1-aminomutase|nr:aminotransferase class III-fold pyridoxal phosphate-dependent enzyme [Clostridiales bacterium]